MRVVLSLLVALSFFLGNILAADPLVPDAKWVFVRPDLEHEWQEFLVQSTTSQRGDVDIRTISVPHNETSMKLEKSLELAKISDVKLEKNSLTFTINRYGRKEVFAGVIQPDRKKTILGLLSFPEGGSLMCYLKQTGLEKITFAETRKPRDSKKLNEAFAKSDFYNKLRDRMINENDLEKKNKLRIHLEVADIQEDRRKYKIFSDLIKSDATDPSWKYFLASDSMRLAVKFKEKTDIVRSYMELTLDIGQQHSVKSWMPTERQKIIQDATIFSGGPGYDEIALPATKKYLEYVKMGEDGERLHAHFVRNKALDNAGLEGNEEYKENFYIIKKLDDAMFKKTGLRFPKD